MKPQGVSIVICCHNGANRLPETIRHIALQRVAPFIPWELIIIDNGCTDNSTTVARIEWQKHRVNTYMRVVKEPMLGLSHARARGFREARYEYVVLCDDDNWLDENYVSGVYSLLSSKPNIGAAGGLGSLLYEIDPPTEELSYIFAAGPQAPQPGKVVSNKVYGAGCAIRYSAYERILANGFKSLLTDRKGGQLSSGGDYELCLAIAIIGYDIWYDDQLRFTHFITRERLTWDYFLRYAGESSRCFNVIQSYKVVASNTRIHHHPRLAVLKEFMVCGRTFMSTNWKLLISDKASLKRALYFRHVIFRCAIIAYVTKFQRIVETHKMILRFQESCHKPQVQILKPIPRKEYGFRSAILSFQGLRDRLHNVFGA